MNIVKYSSRAFSTFARVSQCKFVHVLYTLDHAVGFYLGVNCIAYLHLGVINAFIIFILKSTVFPAI
jgi:hypothetical protein